MDRAVYERMAELEAEHWWFAGRRRIIREILTRLAPLPDQARILEAGCGTGGNLGLLSDFGTLEAFETDAAARDISRQRFPGPVEEGRLPGGIPFQDRRFDAVCLFDVLEHVEDDVAALAALGKRLAAGGRIILTVPAMPWMWSRHDERHHHFRRYTRANLARTAAQAGFVVERSFYFNAFLFPLAVAQRAVKGLTGSDSPDDAMPPAIVNRILTFVFSAERHLVGRVPFPFGLSCAAILRPAGDGQQ